MFHFSGVPLKGVQVLLPRKIPLSRRIPLSNKAQGILSRAVPMSKEVLSSTRTPTSNRIQSKRDCKSRQVKTSNRRKPLVNRMHLLNRDPRSRIVGGRVAFENEYPFMARVTVSGFIFSFLGIA